MLTSCLLAVILVAVGETAIWSATHAQNQAGASVEADARPAANDAAPQQIIPAITFSPAADASGEPAAPAAFDKAARSLDDPTSIWFVVNKARPIPDAANYVPPDLVSLRQDIPNPNGFPLRHEAADALAAMVDAAKAEAGQQLIAQSGYRSYSIQVNAYTSYVNRLGTTGADSTSARAGFSEHQTGMAIDILASGAGCSLDGPCFGSTAAGEWLAANAYRFGFLLRYPADKTQVTGYEYEPWHFRYVGVDLATEMHKTGVETLEEFFGLPAAPDYLE
ncbi:D-alanyl-D-alanine carboxypeptidase [Agreia sp. COWG]|nr:D-alanyl-D-alanine carboxypeptidase [Agreia sp. COWG]